jgi:hypothetical protein
MMAAVFNPLTVQFLKIGRGLDTVTSLLLLLALGAVSIGILRSTGEKADPPGAVETAQNRH